MSGCDKSYILLLPVSVFAVIIFLPLSPTSGYLGVFLVISSGDVARSCEAYFLPAFSLSIIKGGGAIMGTVYCLKSGAMLLSISF